MSAESVVIAVDGESKCGKTTVIDTIAAEAMYQSAVVPGLLDGSKTDWQFTDDTRQALGVLQDMLRFDRITTISAGNSFRAASLYLSLLELEGKEKASFDESDSDKVRDLLAIDGILEVLQDDPNVATNVSKVATMAGVQALCGTIFCDFVAEACRQSDGANLVIVDARNPLGTMGRNSLIGHNFGQISPSRLMPLYVETPTEVAAQRMSGDFVQNLDIVKQRRTLDANRREFPVTRPEHLIDSFEEWRQQFPLPQTSDGIALPYRLYNGAEVGLDNVQLTASLIASSAQDLVYTLRNLPTAK